MPSDTLIVDETIETPTQRLSRTTRPREMTEDIDPIQVEDMPAGIDPEQALADAHKTITARERETAAATARAVAAERDAQQARDVAAQTQNARVGDRQAAVTVGVERAKADRDAAVATLRMAREAGDFDAEVAATESLADARYRFQAGTAELEALKSRPPAQAQGTDGMTPEARAWVAAHPAFNTDPAYKQAAIDAHTLAINDGAPEGSPAYIRLINAKLAEQFGADHGTGRRDGQQQEQHMQEPEQRRQPARSTGAPPSRGNGGGGGPNVVQTLLGPVTVQQRGNGTVGLQIPPHLKADFEEGAKVGGFVDLPGERPGAGLARYTMEQVNIARERTAGGSGGMITGEGNTYR